jgi:threonyl-tRNA synthetase
LTKEEALKLFAYNPFKVQLVASKIPDGGKVTAYRNGDLIDLCTGPHVPNTGRVKAFKVLKNSSSYWLGKATNDSLQRIYGVTFPNKKELDDYITLIEEAAKRDHRIIGK